MRKKLSVLLSVGSLFCLVACGAGKNKTNVELIQDMMDQIALKAQSYDKGRGEPTNRLPPEGTVARNREAYLYSGDPLGAEKSLENPHVADRSEPFMARGAEKFRIYCGVCHGATGAGDGPVAGKMTLRPPSLLTPKVKDFKDGRIFHIITEGQGVMGAYASQIPNPKDRWAIVNYVRVLQEKGGN
jgi:mono/diheme cytochrome c family protein